MRGALAALLTLLAALGSPPLSQAAERQDLAPLLSTLRQVEREGRGHQAANKAWATLASQATVDDLPTILAAMDGAAVLPANWLRAAVDTIAERHMQAHGKLPLAGLETFLAQKSHDPKARRLAYEWIARNDATASERLIPTMLDDPSLELRRDAVAQVLASAEALAKEEKKAEALAAYRKVLEYARDLDQVKATTEALAKLGEPVDLARHYGFLLDWKLVGPFDSRGGKGFAAVYPVEEKLDLAASYDTENGPVRFRDYHSEDEYGAIDINTGVGKHMGAAAYAYAEFQSDKARVAELRLGSPNAIKIWLNGKLLASADVYHANNTMDQYVGRGELKPGKNVILVKVCQNEQTEDWAQDWKFGLRVCDRLGKAILSTDRPASQPAKKPAADKADNADQEQAEK